MGALKSRRLIGLYFAHWRASLERSWALKRVGAIANDYGISTVAGNEYRVEETLS